MPVDRRQLKEGKYLLISWAQALLPALFMAVSFHLSLNTEMAVVKTELLNMKELGNLLRQDNADLKAEVIRLGMKQAGIQAKLDVLEINVRHLEERDGGG